MQGNIKPGTLVHVGFVGHTDVGMFISYNRDKNVPTRNMRTCNVLVGEEVVKVWLGLVKPIEEET
jgi:hypothetical protein